MLAGIVFGNLRLKITFPHFKKQIMKAKNFLPAVGLLFLASCGGNNSNSTTSDTSQMAKDTSQAKTDNSTVSSDTAKVASTVSNDDLKFVADAANAGMMEVELGKVAQQNSTTADVKNFGEMMVTDHTKIGDDLSKIASSKHIMMPISLPQEDQNKIDDLKKKTGKDFNKAYMDAMVSGHKKVIAMLEDETKKGSDTDIKAFASNTLPTINKHLEAAKKCEMMVKK